jgi:hypothetical protein
MEVRILYIEDCPNIGLAEQRVREVADGDPEIRIVRQRVADPADTAATGLHGSPTILIDGVDPFAAPDTEPSWACRVFLSAYGIQGAPSTKQLREAMGRLTAADVEPSDATAERAAS